MLEDLARHPLGEVDNRVIVLDIDAADIATLKPGFVSNGADDLARRHAMLMADLDPIADQIRILATRLTALRTLWSLIPTLTGLAALGALLSAAILMPIAVASRRSLRVLPGARRTDRAVAVAADPP